MDIPVYELRIRDDDSEVDYIALVDLPAIERDFIAFNSQINIIVCKECGHSWSIVDGGNKPYMCKCGYDNTPKKLDLAEGMPHYTSDGELYTGPTHKDADGKLMTGATHTEDSEYLYHKGEFAEIGPKGGVRESKKAPKSKTENENPKGEGTAKGNASGKRGAEVTQEQEKTLQNKVDDFNEKDSNTKYGRATLGALKSVFQRGIGAYNTSHSPEVKSSEQWAYARCNAFLYLLKNGRPENAKYTTDYDLLPKDHPKSKEKMNEDFADTYNDYPKQATENAKIALRWAEENGWGECGTPVGKERANQLANGENISRDTIARMAGFERHRQNSNKELGVGCGRLMWLCWGGDAGIEWASRKLEQIDKLKAAFAITNEDRRIISGPLMLADKLIFRTNDEMGNHYVKFSKDTIQKIAIKYAKRGYQKNVNVMHDEQLKIEGVVLFESFITDKERGILPMKGYEDSADGSWFGSMYVENDEAWQAVKENKLKGFSVEGFFDYDKPKETAEQKLKKIIELLFTPITE